MTNSSTKSIAALLLMTLSLSVAAKQTSYYSNELSTFVIGATPPTSSDARSLQRRTAVQKTHKTCPSFDYHIDFVPVERVMLLPHEKNVLTALDSYDGDHFDMMVMGAPSVSQLRALVVKQHLSGTVDVEYIKSSHLSCLGLSWRPAK